MSEIITNGSPYYDDYDPQKKFTQIIAVPGRAEQAREFTQSQTMLLDFLQRLSGTLFKEGSIVAGMGTYLSGTTLTVESGRIYLGGIIHEFEEQTLEITGEGTEVIGARVIKSIVTEAMDSSLRDPSQGFDNYAQAGAHRVKQEIQITLNDPMAPTIAVYVDGYLQSDTQRPEIDVILDLLAKRTYDQSGNYRVSGFDMYKKSSDDYSVKIMVDPGKAYIKGYEVSKPSPTILNVPRALDTRIVIGEMKAFVKDTTLYMLNNTGVKEIDKIVATVEVTKTITRGNISNGVDLLPDTPVVSIQKIVSGLVEYKQGVDFQLSSDRVSWALPGDEPSIGSSYEVTYRYNKVLVKGIDYVLTNDNADFSPTSLVIVDGSNIYIDYKYYLARIDRVYVTYTGEIVREEGISDRPEYVVEPITSGDYRMSLGTLRFEPNSPDPTIINDTVTRMSMGQLHDLAGRVDNLEYNLAVNDLDNEAMAGEAPTNLKGIFTDGFLGFSKSDLGHSDYNMAVDISEHEIRQPSDFTISTPKVNIDASTQFGNFKDIFLTAPFTESVVLSQMSATRTMNVNPYAVFPGLSAISLKPEKDTWINTDTMQINTSTVNTEVVWGWWNGQDGTSTTSSSTTSTSVRDTLVSYARQIPLNVSAVDFPPNSDDLVATIDGIRVPLTPTGKTVAGSIQGSIKVDGDGAGTARFTIPANIRSGAREVVLENGIATAKSVFVSEGINRTVTNTTHTTSTITERRELPPVVTNVDPLAQSFQLTEDRFVTGINLYFKTKSKSLPLKVLVRTMVNGFPGNVILAEAEVKPSQVNISDNASVTTRVEFDTPAYCESNVQYCVVVQTESTEYTMWVATLGGKDVTTGKNLIKQPYNEGTLFSSSNNITWTAEQDSDLKFQLLVADFAPSATIEFNKLDGLDFDAFLLALDHEEVLGCSMQIEFNTGLGWLPITSWNLRHLTSLGSEFTFRCKMVTNGRVSPILVIDSLQLVTTKVKLSGSYISKLVQTSQNFTHTKQVVEAYIPSGSTLEVQVSLDDSTWVAANLVSTELVDQEFSRYTFNYNLPGSTVSKQYRARINLVSNNRLSKPRARKLLNILT